MAKKHIEEFNPWPGFVDIFSSVILVMLLFLLVAFVNIVYYSQYKFKVAYTSAILNDKVISAPETKKAEVLEKKEEVQKEVQAKEFVGIEAAGKDLSRIYEDAVTKQEVVMADEHLLVNFGSNDIKIDNQIIVKIREFINKIKQKNIKHTVKISAVDPTNQISATVMKQISLARTLNTRNLIRQMGYDIKDVRVDLLHPNAEKIVNQNNNGYIIIRIEKK
ncbi:hypothetical protein [Sulfurimonas sp.]|uniref:hypothetical protein n=1 Tax=Sulfurimonas sp. TaxID=2022749 RepID=UPI00261D3846|nr:hypothetical protein [Sulfurimonas sp.]MDD3451217.1 hypothetical protein [Sulfurimonas sp.]